MWKHRLARTSDEFLDPTGAQPGKRRGKKAPDPLTHNLREEEARKVPRPGARAESTTQGGMRASQDG